MSQYINFYIKTEKEKYINILNYSRNSVVYEYMEKYAPYDDGKEITDKVLASIFEDVRSEKSKYEETLNKFKDRAKLVASFNNTVEEKMEEINNIEECIASTNEVKDELDFFENFLGVISAMTEDLKYGYNTLMFGIEWDPTYNKVDYSTTDESTQS